MLTCVTTTELLVRLTDYVDSIAQDAVAKLYRCAAEIQIKAAMLQLSISCRDTTWLTVWLSLGTETTRLRFGKHHVLAFKHLFLSPKHSWRR